MKTLNNSQYQALVDVLMNHRYNAEDVVSRLVKVNPVLFLDLIGEKYEAEPYLREVVKFLQQSKKVEAVRTLRIHTGFGLKQAVDAINAVINNQGNPFDELDPRHNLYTQMTEMIRCY